MNTVVIVLPPEGPKWRDFPVCTWIQDQMQRGFPYRLPVLCVTDMRNAVESENMKELSGYPFHVDFLEARDLSIMDRLFKAIYTAMTMKYLYAVVLIGGEVLNVRAIRSMTIGAWRHGLCIPFHEPVEETDEEVVYESIHLENYHLTYSPPETYTESFCVQIPIFWKMQTTSRFLFHSMHRHRELVNFGVSEFLVGAYSMAKFQPVFCRQAFVTQVMYTEDDRLVDRLHVSRNCFSVRDKQLPIVAVIMAKNINHGLAKAYASVVNDFADVLVARDERFLGEGEICDIKVSFDDGYASARNQILKKIKESVYDTWILFMDDDHEVSSEFVGSLRDSIMSLNPNFCYAPYYIHTNKNGSVTDTVPYMRNMMVHSSSCAIWANCIHELLASPETGHWEDAVYLPGDAIIYDHGTHSPGRREEQTEKHRCRYLPLLRRAIEEARYPYQRWYMMAKLVESMQVGLLPFEDTWDAWLKCREYYLRNDIQERWRLTLYYTILGNCEFRARYDRDARWIKMKEDMINMGQIAHSNTNQAPPALADTLYPKDGYVQNVGAAVEALSDHRTNQFGTEQDKQKLAEAKAAQGKALLSMLDTKPAKNIVANRITLQDVRKDDSGKPRHISFDMDLSQKELEDIIKQWQQKRVLAVPTAQGGTLFVNLAYIFTIQADLVEPSVY